MWKRLYLDPAEGGSGGGGGEGGKGGEGGGDAATQLADLKAKNGELRQNNIELQKQLKGLSDRFGALGDMTADEIQSMRAIVQKAANDEEAKLIKDGKWDDVVARRTDSLRKGFEKRESKLAEELQASRAGAAKFRDIVRDFQFTNAAQAAAAKLKVEFNPGALPDLLSRGRGVFDIDDQTNLVPRGPDGKPYLGDRGDPITVDEWVNGLLDSAPHLFKGAVGGGATGGAGGSGQRVVDRRDPAALGKAAADILAGKAVVR